MSGDDSFCFSVPLKLRKVSVPGVCLLTAKYTISDLQIAAAPLLWRLTRTQVQETRFLLRSASKTSRLVLIVPYCRSAFKGGVSPLMGDAHFSIVIDTAILSKRC